MIRAAMMSAASRRGAAPVPQSQVHLLVHGDTGLTDSSPAARSVTNVGSVAVGTPAKFGEGALAFTTAGQRLDYSGAGSEIALPGDFTVELWARWSSSQSNPTLVERFRYSVGGWRLSGGTSGVRFSTTTSSGTNTRVSSSVSRNTGQWYHLAVTRQGSTYRLFVDGALVSTGTDSLAIASAADTPVSVGGSAIFGSSETHIGLIDDLRITVGTARYTAAFTPPTAAFPDS